MFGAPAPTPFGQPAGGAAPFGSPAPAPAAGGFGGFGAPAPAPAAGGFGGFGSPGACKGLQISSRRIIFNGIIWPIISCSPRLDIVVLPFRYLDLVETLLISIFLMPMVSPFAPSSIIPSLLSVWFPTQRPRQLLLDSVASEVRLLPLPPLGSAASGRLPPRPRPLVLLHLPQRE